MKCPKCDKTPISLLSYSILGWKYITCSYCSSKLKMRSVGKLFWRAIIASNVILLIESEFFSEIKKLIGPNISILLFFVTIILAIIIPLYLSWRDGQLEIYTTET